jgi:hypothetical protein
MYIRIATCFGLSRPSSGKTHELQKSFPSYQWTTENVHRNHRIVLLTSAQFLIFNILILTFISILCQYTHSVFYKIFKLTLTNLLIILLSYKTYQSYSYYLLSLIFQYVAFTIWRHITYTLYTHTTHIENLFTQIEYFNVHQKRSSLVE